MQKTTKYVIFRTKWGYFGLAGIDTALRRTCLPEPKPEKVKLLLLRGLPAAQFDRRFFADVQEQIKTYFDGVCVNFSPDIPVMLDGFSPFCTSVLTACRRVTFGQTVTYAGLAKRSGYPRAVRAVGNALAKNPLPLLIPCHRIIRNDGRLGGFSAPGGLSLKKKLLVHERDCR
jgi:O-6-methylguanine DNA methyltransferase